MDKTSVKMNKNRFIKPSAALELLENLRKTRVARCEMFVSQDEMPND
jgi:hypothetical protein